MSEDSPVRSYKDLLVWRKAMRLAADVYRATACFPSDERFGLTSQARRCAPSIAANIAEGHGRGSTKDFVRFLWIANGSRTELETHLLLAAELDFMERSALKPLLSASDEVGRMLVGLRRSLEKERGIE